MLYHVKVYVDGIFRGWYRGKKTLTRQPQEKSLYTIERKHRIESDLKGIYCTHCINTEWILKEKLS